jgi:Fe-S cluster assembly protein SufD
MKTQLVEVTTDQQIHVTQDTQFVVQVKDYFNENPVTIELLFDKQGVSAEIILVYSVPVKGNLNVTTVAHHMVPNTSCMTKVRGILNDKASSNYVGKILIDKGAQQTSSFLEDGVLVIGNGTKNNSQPILMIEADDVRASHGATTGRINEEEIYYLQARGLSRKEAEKLVVEGFLTGLLDDIIDAQVKEKVLKDLEEVQ